MFLVKIYFNNTMFPSFSQPPAAEFVLPEGQSYGCHFSMLNHIIKWVVVRVSNFVTCCHLHEMCCFVSGTDDSDIEEQIPSSYSFKQVGFTRNYGNNIGVFERRITKF